MIIQGAERRQQGWRVRRIEDILIGHETSRESVIWSFWQLQFQLLYSDLD